jgi:hypothetical protein
MRLRGRDGIARPLYLTATGRRVVILRVFTKKTQKTPRCEIELAGQRAKGGDMTRKMIPVEIRSDIVLRRNAYLSCERALRVRELI